MSKKLSNRRPTLYELQSFKGENNNATQKKLS